MEECRRATNSPRARPRSGALGDAKMQMEFTNLEGVYELLAESIDKAGEEKAPLFLAKLALLLAREVADPAKAREAIEAALIDL